LTILLVALTIILNWFPQIQQNSFVVAGGILATAIELVGFVKDHNLKKESKPGGNLNQINIGDVKGPVATGGEVVDMKETTGAIYKPTGTVNQHIGNLITQIVPPSEKLPVPRIQTPPQDFTGREEELRGLLSSFSKGATITGLRGMGGIGKTALALVLADRLKSRFQDGQIFIKLDCTSPNPLKPPDAMVQVIRAFRGSAERLPEDQDELQSLYNSVLKVRTSCFCWTTPTTANRLNLCCLPRAALRSSHQERSSLSLECQNRSCWTS
jgi:hypothetical protein